MGMFKDLHNQDCKDAARRHARSRSTPPPGQAATMAAPARPEQPQATPAPEPAALAQAASPVTLSAAAPAGTPARLPDDPVPRDVLDLSQMPYRKLSCLLTPAEHRALDLLKLELAGRLDSPITKENLVRCAIHYLVEDYHRRGAASPVLAPLAHAAGER